MRWFIRNWQDILLMEIYLKDESTRLRRVTNLATLQIVFGPEYLEDESDESDEDEDEEDEDEELKDKEAEKKKAWRALQNTWLAMAVSRLCERRKTSPVSLAKQYADAISLAAQGKDLQTFQKLPGSQLLFRSTWNLACDPGNRNQAKVSQTLSFLVVQEYLAVNQYRPKLFRGCEAACRLRASLAALLTENHRPEVSIDPDSQRRTVTPRKWVYADNIRDDYHAASARPSVTVSEIDSQLEQATILGKQQKEIIRLVQTIENSSVAHLQEVKRKTAVVASEVSIAVTQLIRVSSEVRTVRR